MEILQKPVTSKQYAEFGDKANKQGLIINDMGEYWQAEKPVVTLQQLKAEKWQQIKTARDNAEQSGVEYMEKVLDSDQISVQRLTVAVQTAQAALMAGQEFSIDWTCQDNTTLTMTAQELIGVPVALATHANNLHAKARELREQIQAAESVEELEVIIW